ncbi:MAG: hypothetical protein ACLFVR_08465 [Thiohalospira sp.]
MLINNNYTRKIDFRIRTWMRENAPILLRWSVGIIFLWFGALKFFKGVSPAESLAIETIRLLTFGWFSDALIINGLALWEVIVGIGLITGFFLRGIILLLFLQMLGTLSPIFLFPDEVFVQIPFVLTLEGQYIVKNLVLMSAGVAIGGTLKDPK